MVPPLISYIGSCIFFLELVLNGFLFVKLYQRWQETKIKVVAVLSGFYLLFLLYVTIEFFFFILTFNDPVGFYLQEGNLIVFLFPFFGGMSAGFFMLFIDYFENESIYPIHGFFYGVFFGGFILNIMFQLFYPLEQIMSLEISPLILLSKNFLFSTNFPASYFIIYVVVVTLSSLRRIKGNIDDPAQKKQVSLMQLAIVFYYFLTMIVVAGGYQLAELLDPATVVFLRHIAPHISVIIGGVMIFQAYVKAPIGFLQFQKLEKIMVINRSGLLLFSYDFLLTKEGEDSQDALFSGGVFALITLFSDMIKTKNIKMIHFQDKMIMLSHNENFVTFLIVDRVTSFLWGALASFSNMFNLKYGLDDHEYSVVPKSVFKDAKTLLKLTFGHQ